MPEDWLRTMDSDRLERLTLRLVDGHGKRQNHGELVSLESERNFRVRWTDCDLWNEHNLSLVLANSMLRFDDVVGQTADEKTGPIAKTVLGIQVFEAHNHAALFQPIIKNDTRLNICFISLRYLYYAKIPEAVLRKT
jgi:hypothetical protein